MTIDRIAVYSAEHRINTDLAYYAGAPAAISSTQAKTGTYSYSRGTNNGPIGKAFATPLAAIRAGFWMYMASATIQNTTYLYHSGMAKVNNQTSSRINIKLDAGTGNMTIVRPLNGSADEVLATAAIPSQFATLSTWFPIGITHKIHATDGFMGVYVGGVPILNYVGDTRPSYNSGGQTFDVAMAFALFAGAGGTSGLQGFANAFLDDLYIDSYVGEVDSIVPARRFLISLPNAAGADAAWTPLSSTNVSNVDDNPNDGDTTYNKALATALRDTFNFANITVPTDHRIVAVLPHVFAKRLDSEINNGISVHAWDGLQYEDSADLSLFMSYDIPAFARMTLQPDGSVWDETDFNAMQFGYRSRGTF